MPENDFESTNFANPVDPCPQISTTEVMLTSKSNIYADITKYSSNVFNFRYVISAPSLLLLVNVPRPGLTENPKPTLCI